MAIWLVRAEYSRSGDIPANRHGFTQLVGAMQNIRAEQVLFVS